MTKHRNKHKKCNRPTGADSNSLSDYSAVLIDSIQRLRRYPSDQEKDLIDDLIEVITEHEKDSAKRGYDYVPK